MGVSLKKPVQNTRITIKDDDNTFYLDLYGESAATLQPEIAKAMFNHFPELQELGEVPEFKVRAKRNSDDNDDETPGNNG